MSDIISNGTGSSIETQWLASRSVGCGSADVTFYIRCVSDWVSSWFFYRASGETRYDMYANYRVRPVVSLESDIQLSGNSNDGWTIN